MQGYATGTLAVPALPLAQVVPVFFFLLFILWAIYTIVPSHL